MARNNIYVFVVICIGVLIAFPNGTYAQTIGFNNIYLGLHYTKVKEILHNYGYTVREFKNGPVKYIQYTDNQSEGMLIFNFFDRLYTILITIPINDEQFAMLQKHLQRKYGEFQVDDGNYFSTVGMYRITLYRSTIANTATVEYSHINPLFYPKKEIKENPFSKF